MTKISYQEIKTKVFRTGSAPHAKAAAESVAARWWWVAVPLAVIAVYGSLADTRWLIAALAVLLLLLPTLALFGYLSAIGNRDAVAALFPRTASFHADGSVAVNSLPLPSDDGHTASGAPPRLMIARNEINDARLRGRHLEILFGRDERRLLIPLDAFNDPHEAVILAAAFGKPAVNS